jgi:hypothetical protein
VSVVKTQSESAMAKTSEQVLVAHQLHERRKTIKARKERLREKDFAIETFRTLSEEP